MKLLATINNLNLSFGDKTVFKNAGFQINQNDHVALLGLNGKGKSTLLKVLIEEIIPDTSEPKFIYDKANIDQGLTFILIPQDLNTDIDGELGLIENYYLNFYPELKRIHLKIKEFENDETKIEHLSNLYTEFDHLKGNEIHNKYISFLKNLGIEDHSKNIKDLSGGEKRKLALSIGLSTNKHIVLWDEPTNHLDLSTIDYFEKHLNNTSSTYLLISHDRELISNVCNKVLHIRNGEIKEFKGNYYDYLEYLVEEEKAREAKLSRMQNRLRIETAWIRQGVKARRTRSKKRVETYKDLSKDVANLKAGKKQTVELKIADSTRKTKNLIELKHIGHSYDDKILYEDINLKINKGDKLAVIGGNGCGKTTLVNIIMESLIPLKGSVKLAQDLKVNYFSQTRMELNPEGTIWDTIGEGRDFVHFDDRELHIASYMQRFLFDSDELKRPISTFSGGEKNRIQLAMFLKNPADVWIFDEPTNDLDLETIGILEETLSGLDSTAIIISHDRSFLANICNKALVIKNRKTSYFNIIEQAVEHFLNEDNAIEEIAPQILVPKNEEPVKKTKPTYQQKKKFETIEEDIAKLENNISLLDEQLASTDPSDYEKLQQLTDEISLKNQELEALFEEWQELETLFS